MRITAIAREDLSNIGNGLVPNKITLELSGKSYQTVTENILDDMT